MSTSKAEKVEAKVQIDLGSIFDSVERLYGRLTPENLIQDAAQVDHPLHEEFEWNNDLAAHSYRLNQARAIIRRPRTTIIVTGRKIVHPSYVHDPALPAGTQGYVQVARIKSESDLASDALDAELDRAGSALSRARSVALAIGDNNTADGIDAALVNIGRAK